MSEQNETVADIVADMRKAVAPFRIGEDELTHILCAGEVELFAARIEAAAKRERIALVAEAEAAKDARNIMGLKLRMEFQEKCKNCPNVNAAKIRKALEEIIDYLNDLRTQDKIEYYVYSNIFDICDAALAAPPRNCDVGTAEEQIYGFYNFCRVLSKGVSCHGCQFFEKNYDDNHCAILWSQLPYEAPAAQDGGE